LYGALHFADGTSIRTIVAPMPDAGVPALLVLAAYLVGAVPFGLLVPKWVAGVDVRTIGSGNIGATNVSRAIGRKWFFVVLALDAGKGVAGVLLFPRLAGDAAPTWLRVACGLAAVLGHVFSPFLRFKGGKGVATAAGVIAALAPIPAAAALGVFLVVLVASRWMSLASMCAAAALAPLAVALDAGRDVALFGALVAVVVILRHKANIGRIAAGTEPRVFAKKKEQVDV
jgi:glycerol-3-phosphate acyltransferase PlsY